MLLYTELIFQHSKVRRRVSIEALQYVFPTQNPIILLFEAHCYHCYLSPLFPFSQQPKFFNLKILKIEYICTCYSFYPEFCSSYAYINLTNIYWIFTACQTISRCRQYSNEQKNRIPQRDCFLVGGGDNGIRTK